MAKKKAKKSGKKRKPNAAFMKPMSPSAVLAAVVGSGSMPRTEVTKKIWGYIKRNSLQDKKNRRRINADDKLKSVFGGRNQVSMFEMTKLVSRHLNYTTFKGRRRPQRCACGLFICGTRSRAPPRSWRRGSPRPADPSLAPAGR